MNKTKIEWCDYTINPVKGYCPVGCEYCYARRMYDRFKWDKTIRYDDKAWLGLGSLNKPSRIFVGSTIELFGDWIKEDWLQDIFYWVNEHSEKTFIFLTKRPENLHKYNPWPDNCWVGVSATNKEQYLEALKGLWEVQSTVKFLSFEPLLEEIINNNRDHGFVNLLSYYLINWVIIGTETGNRKGKPALVDVYKWAGEIIKAADNTDIPVFIKDNLKWPVVRREWPKAVR